MIVVSANMKEIYRIAEEVAPLDLPVFITGETGTGKSILAEEIHKKSARKDKEYVVVSCGALEGTLLTSELFGHVRGAFTGAYEDARGRIEYADGGTLFLDEITELSPQQQSRILRVVETGKYERIGSPETREADVRYIAATNKDIHEEVNRGNFRLDLYQRLNFIELYLPPLKDRREEIPSFVEYFLQRFNEKHGRQVSGVSATGMAILNAYDWPGNIRELENVVGYGAALSKGEMIEDGRLAERIAMSGVGRRVKTASLVSMPRGDVSYRDFTELAQRSYVSSLLQQHGGNASRSARAAGMSRQGFGKTMRRLGIAPESFRP